jgi:hypothetical protein
MFDNIECIENSIKISFSMCSLIFVLFCAGSPVTCVSILAEEVRGQFKYKTKIFNYKNRMTGTK